MSKTPAVDPDSPAPFGTEPRRGRGPLVFWIVLFAAWFAVLVWLAFIYPAR